MRKILPLVLAAVVGVGTTLTLVAPAEAAASVSIKPIADRFAAPGKTTTIKPVYTKAKNVKVTSARLTVKLGKKTVATSKASVAVKAAADPKTYAITTVVKYKVKKTGYASCSWVRPRSTTSRSASSSRRCLTTTAGRSRPVTTTSAEEELGDLDRALLRHDPRTRHDHVSRGGARRSGPC
jgi:hypothetical protein